MIQAWTGSRDCHLASGVLDRSGSSGSTFAYTPLIDQTRAVSLTMPSRLPSWNWPVGLAPNFEMNLPEGALRERLQRQFGKATGRFDDLDLLAITGRAQLGRLRYSPFGEGLDQAAPSQSVDEILPARRQDGLFDYLMQRHAAQSWIAGVQGQSKANLAVATGFRDGAFLAKRTLDGQKAF